MMEIELKQKQKPKLLTTISKNKNLFLCMMTFFLCILKTYGIINIPWIFVASPILFGLGYTLLILFVRYVVIR